MSGGPHSLPRVPPPVPTDRRPRSIAALALVLACLTPAGADAASGGGMFGSERPAVGRVSCVSGCAGIATARPGGLVRVHGARLGQVAYVAFLGGRGRRDNVVAPATRVSSSAVEVRVPPDAVTGRVRVINGDGNRSTASRRTLRIGVGTGGAAKGIGPVEARVESHRVFYDGRRRAALTYLVRGDRPAVVVVELVRSQDGASIVRWGPLLAPPQAVQTIEWDGTAGGKVQREGRYEFRIAVAVQRADARTAQTAVSAVDGFVFLRHRFPVRGAHAFGEEIARFGAARDGHTHQGQDVFAACGTPLVAARGGVVKIKQFQSRAGNYLVIDGEGTGVDYAYMHLRDPALFDKGDRVYTGQVIGYVGDTGVARGCHLHFEMWSAPGWYSGGEPFDPLAQLMAWDAVS
jgi:murein DD-endopeptidase MepM/ murein hydrolase activator NlpD